MSTAFVWRLLDVQWKPQQELKEKAGDRWQPLDLVFTTEVGTPFEGRNMTRTLHRILRQEGFITKYDGYRQMMEEVKMPLTVIDALSSCPAYGTLSELCKETGKDRVSGTVMVLEGLRDEWNQRSIDRLQKELRLLVAPNFLDEDPFDICLVAPEFKVDNLLSANDIIRASYAKVEASISNNVKKSEIRYKDITGKVKSKDSTYEIPLSQRT